MRTTRTRKAASLTEKRFTASFVKRTFRRLSRNFSLSHTKNGDSLQLTFKDSGVSHQTASLDRNVRVALNLKPVETNSY